MINHEVIIWMEIVRLANIVQGSSHLPLERGRPARRPRCERRYLHFPTHIDQYGIEPAPALLSVYLVWTARVGRLSTPVWLFVVFRQKTKVNIAHAAPDFKITSRVKVSLWWRHFWVFLLNHTRMLVKQEPSSFSIVLCPRQRVFYFFLWWLQVVNSWAKRGFSVLLYYMERGTVRTYMLLPLGTYVRTKIAHFFFDDIVFPTLFPNRLLLFLLSN